MVEESRVNGVHNVDKEGFGVRLSLPVLVSQVLSYNRIATNPPDDVVDRQFLIVRDRDLLDFQVAKSRLFTAKELLNEGSIHLTVDIQVSLFYKMMLKCSKETPHYCNLMTYGALLGT